MNNESYKKGARSLVVKMRWRLGHDSIELPCFLLHNLSSRSLILQSLTLVRYTTHSYKQ